MQTSTFTPAVPAQASSPTACVCLWQETTLHIACQSLQAGGVRLAGPLAIALPQGELVVLRGANGVGKSTWMRQAALALCEQQPGLVALLKPDYGLRDELTVAQQLQAALGLAARPACDWQTCLLNVGLEDWAWERVGVLSSGQRARLGSAMLQAMGAPCWFLDEPLNALDDEGVACLAQMVQNHLNQGGWVWMVSHLPTQMLTQACGANNAPLQAPLRVHEYHLQTNGVFPSGVSLVGKPIEPIAVDGLPPKVGKVSYFKPLLKREFWLLFQAGHELLWGALLHWMVLSLFGFTLRHAELDVVRVLVWVSAILAMLMGTHAWFAQDHRVRWLLSVQLAAPYALGWVWLSRCVLLVLAQGLLLVPVSALMLVQSGADAAQVWPMATALLLGLLAMAPILGLLALLVLMTRAASVLVYLLALPLLLPVVVFGVESSQAAALGRNAGPALAVLASLAALGLCLGVPLSRRLIQLSQE